jgi:hypothetical protein
MAEREYTFDGSKPPKKVTVRIGFRKKRLIDDRYECCAEVDLGDETIVRPMNGVDAFEALQLAIINIGILLWLYSGRGEDRLSWLDGKRRISRSRRSQIFQWIQL